MGIPTLVLGVLATTGRFAQADHKPEILVVGTYHMANPPGGLFNTQADDVLAPKRQKEVAELVEILERFRPTKVAVEIQVGNKAIGLRYADYLAGKVSLRSNETDQVAFRVAKDLGLNTVYPVDEEGDFPFERLSNFAKANGLSNNFDQMMARVRERVDKEAEFLRSHTILDYLKLVNSDATVAKCVAEYFDYIPYADPDEYAGPDLIGSWYRRNLCIYHNIVHLVDSPRDRILVIYGLGHLGWLRQDVENDQNVRLRKLAEFVGQE